MGCSPLHLKKNLRDIHSNVEFEAFGETVFEFAVRVVPPDWRHSDNPERSITEIVVKIKTSNKTR
jgi:hypothetical protein